MRLHRVLRAALAGLVALAGVAIDEQEALERITSQAARLGLVPPADAARPPPPKLDARSLATLPAAPPEGFLGAPKDDARDRPAPTPPGGPAPAVAAASDEPSSPGVVAAVRGGDEARPTGTAAPEEPAPTLDLDAPAGDADDAAAETVDFDHEAPGPDEPVLVSTGRETWVFAEPRWESRKLGYLRAGAIVRRRAQVATHRDCRGGWYRVEPRGYVCVGSRASLERSHPIARLSARRPDRAGLPYAYALTRYPTPPLYARLPTDEEQRAVEGPVEAYRKALAALRSKPEFVPPPPPDPLPAELADGRLLPATAGDPRAPDQLVLGHARMRSGWALLGTYESGTRRFGLTTELMLVPLDRTRIVKPSSFHGVELSDEYGLPLAITRARTTRSYRIDAGAAVTAGPSLGLREALPLTGREHRWRDGLLLEVRDGSWVRADQVTVIERPQSLPRFARRGTKWIDVSILRQSLVAYEGPRPVYATLVSTGKDGLEDPAESHATVQGTFLVHTKHLTVTMDAEPEEGEEFDLRDVPFVQYFKEGYALHAAYWHDDFGTARSHGCVNLAPIDAAWLFGWTTPGVPEGWHAAMSLKEGTIVHIHP
ncbi:MAG: L,D-transpeptidase [Deltaproteobacteria bacterium]|nr:L,D-transpeptidase [Deltaproteobacteria bacterium]